MRKKWQEVISSISKYFQSFFFKRKERASVIRCWLGSHRTRFWLLYFRSRSAHQLLETMIPRTAQTSRSELVSTISFQQHTQNSLSFFHLWNWHLLLKKLGQQFRNRNSQPKYVFLETQPQMPCLRDPAFFKLQLVSVLGKEQTCAIQKALENVWATVAHSDSLQLGWFLRTTFRGIHHRSCSQLRVMQCQQLASEVRYYWNISHMMLTN